MTHSEKMREIIRHIRRVEDNCNEMSIQIIERGLYDEEFARQLVIRGRIHDASKFEEFEFNHLWKGDPKFDEALKIHHSKNRHHPEFHKNGIKDMTDLDLAEFVCDTTARAQEFGTDIKKWLIYDDNLAPKKYDYIDDKNIKNKILLFLNLISIQKFK